VGACAGADPARHRGARGPSAPRGGRRTAGQGGRDDPQGCEDAAVRSFLTKVVVNAIALWVATLVVPGIDAGGGGAAKTIGTLLVVGLVFGIVNAFIKPIVRLVALPFYVLTLGLFSFVVNAFMLQITEWLSGPLRISFAIDEFFWSAIGAAVVITFVSMVLNLVLPDGD
jgi:putative membrane protein